MLEVPFIVALLVMGLGLSFGGLIVLAPIAAVTGSAIFLLLADLVNAISPKPKT